MSADHKKFYLTTPIYYVNARPHIGHAYTTIVADVLARRHRLLGDDTFFLTGTDEHGQKIERSAAAAGVPPQQFTDQVAAEFKTLWDRMGITYDKFIRTTDPAHKLGVQQLWRELVAKDQIYLASYTGSYCVSDEAFVDAPAGTPCPDCGRLLETVTEENYFFKLSDYQKQLIELIESDRLEIEPIAAKNEVMNFLCGSWASIVNAALEQGYEDVWDKTPRESYPRLKELGIADKSDGGQIFRVGALKDLSISRTTFDWGIPVPGNPKHVIYVWLDALANYITAIGYGSDDPADQAKFEKYWPADLHLVGKEITRFHCVYWPAFLMAANLRLPKSVVANGWLLFEESKMSKSRGNVVRTETILDAFGPLCPPVPPALDTGAVIPSDPKPFEGESKDPRISPDAPPTSVISSDAHTNGAGANNDVVILSEGVADAESKDLRLSLTPPTKAQQDLFAADVLRYFLLREIPFGQDGSFSFDALITRYNADLANGYGNLISRTLSMIEKYCESEVPTDPSNNAAFREQFAGFITDFGGYFDQYKFGAALTHTSGAIGTVDAMINELKPWKLAASQVPDDLARLHFALYTAAESIRIITALLYPIMPYATASVWRQLGLGSIEEAARNGELKNLQWGGLKPGTRLGPLAPIFPRADKGLAQIMTDMENPIAPPAPEPAPEAKASEPTAKALNAASPSTEVPPGALGPAPGTSLISIDDFAKVDLRVAQIVVAERIPKADKLLRLEVDLGPNFPRRQILAGIAEHYAPESLIGRKVVIVANLAPRKMRGLESQGMVVAASIGPDGAPVLAGFLEEVELGARLK
jgi:methionyl-tRNA synthetase